MAQMHHGNQQDLQVSYSKRNGRMLVVAVPTTLPFSLKAQNSSSFFCIGCSNTNIGHCSNAVGPDLQIELDDGRLVTRKITIEWMPLDTSGLIVTMNTSTSNLSNHCIHHCSTLRNVCLFCVTCMPNILQDTALGTCQW